MVYSLFRSAVMQQLFDVLKGMYHALFEDVVVFIRLVAKILFAWRVT